MSLGQSLQWGRAVAEGDGHSWKVPVRLCGFKDEQWSCAGCLARHPLLCRTSQHFPLQESEQNLNEKIFLGGQGILE